jgi:protein-disulfide isomerase
MTSGKATRDSREAKAAARRAAAARAEARRKNTIRIAVAVVVVLVVVGFGALIQAQRGSSDAVGTSPSGTTGAANQSVVVGVSKAPVTVTVYEDFQCPVCRQFESESGATLDTFVKAETARVEYRPMAFLDSASSTSYSTRALNAAACVVNRSPSSFEAFHDLLFENQPPENSAGLDDARLIALAHQVGAPDVSSCIKNQGFRGWTKRVTDQASKDGVNGTPTVKVNGTVLEDWSPKGLTAAIQAAAAK